MSLNLSDHFGQTPRNFTENNPLLNILWDQLLVIEKQGQLSQQAYAADIQASNRCIPQALVTQLGCRKKRRQYQQKRPHRAAKTLRADGNKEERCMTTATKSPIPQSRMKMTKIWRIKVNKKIRFTIEYITASKNIPMWSGAPFNDVVVWWQNGMSRHAKFSMLSLRSRRPIICAALRQEWNITASWRDPSTKREPKEA